MTTTVLLATIFWYALLVICGGLSVMSVWSMISGYLFNDDAREFVGGLALLFPTGFVGVLLFILSYMMGW
jgi:hypothetical protein